MGTLPQFLNPRDAQRKSWTWPHPRAGLVVPADRDNGERIAPATNQVDELHVEDNARDALATKEIDPDDAVTYANDRRPFQRYVTDTSLMPKLEGTSPTSAAGGG